MKEFEAARGVSGKGRPKRGGKDKDSDTRESSGGAAEDERKEQVRGCAGVEADCRVRPMLSWLSWVQAMIVIEH